MNKKHFNELLKGIKEAKEIHWSIYIAERCLNKFWPKSKGGWDKNCPAYKFALKWVRNNYKRFKSMQFDKIYKEYKKALVQD